MSDLVAGLRALADARPAADEAAAMYDGTVDEVIASARVRRSIGDTGGKFRLNYARVVVSSRLDKLEMSSITTDNDEANALIDEWWQGALADETHDAHEAACEFGEAIVIVWPTELDADGNVTGADILYNDPRSAVMLYDDENPNEPRACVKVWTIRVRDEKRTRVNVYYPDALERWISVSELKNTTFNDADFEQYVDDAGTYVDDAGESFEYPGTWPIPAPLPGLLNAFHLRTGRPHGRPVHADAYGPQNAINKLIATQMGNVDFTGLPQRYVIEDAAEDGGVGEVSADFAEDEIALTDERPRDTEDSAEGLRSEPGGVWRFRNAKATGQYASADPAVFLEPWDKFAQGMSVTTKTPLSAFRATTEMPSGAARRADDAPLNGHVRQLQRRFGSTWQAVYAYAIELVLGIEVDVSITWAPLEAFDDKDTWEVAGLQIATGVPLRKVLTERGYTDDQCDDWGVPALNEKTLTQKTSDLAAVGAAMRDLGTASQLGVVDDAAMKAAIAAVVAPPRSGD